VIRFLSAGGQGSQENFRQLVELIALALAQNIDDLSQRDATILYDGSRLLAATLGEKQRHGAPVCSWTPLHEFLGRQLVNEPNRRRV